MKRVNVRPVAVAVAVAVASVAATVVAVDSTPTPTPSEEEQSVLFFVVDMARESKLTRLLHLQGRGWYSDLGWGKA